MHTRPRRSQIPQAFWGLVSLLYGLALVQRWIYGGERPGLASATGVSAIIAVWIQIYRSRVETPAAPSWTRATYALLAVIACVVVLNIVLMLRQLTNNSAIPLLPGLATFVFSFVFRAVLLDLLSSGDRGGGRRQ